MMKNVKIVFVGVTIIVGLLSCQKKEKQVDWLTQALEVSSYQLKQTAQQ